jgi:hypothetical protein
MSTLYRQVNARPFRSEVNTPSNLREAGATHLPHANECFGGLAARRSVPKCGGWWVRFAGAAQRASRSRGINGSKRMPSTLRDRMTASSTGKPSALTRMRSRGVYSTIPSAMSEATQRGRGRARTSLETSEGTYVDQLAAIGARPSISRTGCYYDNAPMESFFHALKVEFVHQRQSASQQMTASGASRAKWTGQSMSALLG